MLRNYFKTAFRHLLRHKLYSIINIAGLAMGITFTLLAVLYWKDEHSFDTFHENNPHLYRITSNRVTNKEGDREINGKTGHVHGPAFKAGVPEVKEAVRVLGGDISTVLVHEKKAIHLKPLYVDRSFFNVFTFQFLQGNRGTALSDINSVVITETIAKKFFNSTNVVGKIFTQDADPSYQKLQKPLVVTAVIKDPPGNSSLQFDVLQTFDYMELSFQNDNWFGGWLGTFVVLHPLADKQKVIDKFNAIYDAHAKDQLNNIEYNWGSFDPKIRFGLQPMTDVHFNSYLTTSGWNEGGVMNAGRPIYSYAFMGIALFILLMAAINFINISIAGSLKRAREVGIRKISGGRPSQIIVQFLLESSILCFVSFLLAVVLMSILLPVFNSVSGKQLLLSNIFDVKLFIYFFGVLLGVTMLSGLYPAMVLSRFEASKVLYNKQKLSSRNLFGRGLVVTQFSLAVFFVTGAIVYYSQMNFIRTRDLGYNPSFVINSHINGDRDYKTILPFLKQQLKNESSISMVSFGNHGYFENMEINGRAFPAMNKGIDENYLPLMEIPLLAGRNISTIATDRKEAVLVNQAFVKAAGLSEPVGQIVLINRGYDSSYKRIAGVFQDYHFASLREPIKPMMLHIPDRVDAAGAFWVKFDKVNQQKALSAVERIVRSIVPDDVYQFQFVDEQNAAEYLQERRWQKVITFASLLAFVLCSLGLFGLAHLSTNQRVKEIGVRKVLGASVTQIVTLFTTSFIKLVLIAVAISLPVAWIAANRWLDNFAYRIEVGWWMLALSALIALLIAIITVSLQAISAAMVNPAKSLKSE